jgi:hypothetical protein
LPKRQRLNFGKAHYLSLSRTESEDPVEVAHGTEAELADGTEVWFTRDAFQFIVALQQGAGFPVKFIFTI